MKGLLMMLRTMGVQLTDEQATQLSLFLPGFPALATEVYNKIVHHLRESEEREKRMEVLLNDIKRMIENE